MGVRGLRGAGWGPRGAARGAGGRPREAAGGLGEIYAAVNRRDVDAAMELVDEAVVYEDLNFPEPFSGAAGVRQLFEESCSGIPDDLLFVVDDITEGDDLKCGVCWHVELGGVPFPNGRGASFYRLDPQSRKLVYARDLVEPPFKPGGAAFVIIRAVAPLVATLMKKESGPAVPKATAVPTPPSPPFAAAALAAAAAFYTYSLILSPTGQFAPGDPVWQISPETVKEVTDESINFFFVNVGLQALGTGFPADAHHPVSEGLFNLVNAYSFMFLPVLLRLERGQGMNTLAWWSCQMFLTNAVLISYLSRREATLEARRAGSGSGSRSGSGTGTISRAFGLIGGGMGLVSVGWALAARPELGGDLAARADFFRVLLTSDRVAFAFVVDLGLYSIWQAILLGELGRQRGRPVPPVFRFLPFLGLAFFLALDSSGEDADFSAD